MFKFNKMLLFTVFLSSSIFISAQNSSADLEIILRNANAQTVVYSDSFKDLIATETKTFESYKKDGTIDKRIVIESNFIVYQSQRDDSVISEFRNVEKVEGKLISQKDKTPDEFFTEVQKTGSLEKELEKIRKESLRYDKTLEIQGLTLLQAPVLAEHIRPFFVFELIGNGTIDGREVYVISYRQTQKSPYILINEKGRLSELSLSYDLNLPDSIKKSDVFLSGKLLIDAANFQLWGEERVLATNGEKPLVFMKTTFKYQPSEYEFLVPKQISLVQFNAKNYKKNPSAEIKDIQVNFDYSKFTKTNVEVEFLDDDEVPQN